MGVIKTESTMVIIETNCEYCGKENTKLTGICGFCEENIYTIIKKNQHITTEAILKLYKQLCSQISLTVRLSVTVTRSRPNVELKNEPIIVSLLSYHTKIVGEVIIEKLYSHFSKI